MAWTIDFTREGPYRWDNRQRLWLFKYDCTSDANSSGDRTLSTDIISTYGAQKAQPIIKYMKGGMLHGLIYVPDGADTPTSLATMTVDQEDGVNYFNQTVAVLGTGEVFSGNVDSGFSVPFTDMIFASTTLGDTKKAVFKIWVIR